MIVPFGGDVSAMQLAVASRALESCNPALERQGISLSAADVQALVTSRPRALHTAGRVEFGGGVLEDLVLAFAGSPYVAQETFAETIVDLQDLFYEVRNETLDQIPDDDLIARMRSLFDEFAGGDQDYMAEALIDGLGRRVRDENAAMNAYTLAQHRYNVSDWVDETYAPGWDGASWLDE